MPAWFVQLNKSKHFWGTFIWKYFDKFVLSEKQKIAYSFKTTIAWEVFKYAVISGPYFPVFRHNTEIYRVRFIQSKHGPEITFHAVRLHVRI